MAASETGTLARRSAPFTIAGLPWYLWCAALAATSVMIGGHWDISWHMSIGRDSFWTPAHMAIYLCGVLAGIAFGYLILSTTFSKSPPLAASSVHIWGFRAPLGAFIAAWGGIVMLTSAPFDNWWHDAYGLDVKILSPPHVLLFIGIYGVLFGTLLLIAGATNRAATTSEARKLQWMFLYLAGIVTVLGMVITMELTTRPLLHTSRPYLAASVTTPMFLAVAYRTTRQRFAATFLAAFYTLFIIGLILILPLFPAEPKLGPVYQHVTQFIPPQFPILLIVPAFLLDLLWGRTTNWGAWKQAIASAAVFVGSLMAAEWPFADFLMSSAARNRFFGTMYFAYAMPPTSYLVRGLFYPGESAAQFWIGIALALTISTLGIRLGFSRGEWMRTLKR